MIRLINIFDQSSNLHFRYSQFPFFSFCATDFCVYLNLILYFSIESLPPLQSQSSHRNSVRPTSAFSCTDSRIQGPFVPPLALPTCKNTQDEKSQPRAETQRGLSGTCTRRPCISPFTRGPTRSILQTSLTVSPANKPENGQYVHLVNEKGIRKIAFDLSIHSARQQSCGFLLRRKEIFQIRFQRIREN